MSVANTFWEKKALKDMNKEEWELLCDGCGRCCLNKVEYTDTKEIYYTNVACKLLDPKSCRCSNYPERKRIVPDCIQLSANVVKSMTYLPDTCAYRLLSEGKKLQDWHPLISGNKSSVHDAGISVTNKTISEEYVSNLDEHTIRWIKPIKLKNKKKSLRSSK
ncbi:MAG: YcgN family cysteine cluster protein [Bdellovibrionota bacterium]